MKKCKVCKAAFKPVSSMHSVCGPACAIKQQESKRDKVDKALKVADRRETKSKLEKLKSKATLAKEAQTEFNRWVRERDHGKPCISCGRNHQGQNHAGHYLSVGARPELRFEPLNVHLQCAPCNVHLSGNSVKYRIGLIARLGTDVVEWLEGPHDPRKDTREALVSLKAEYAAKARKLIREREHACS